MEQWPAHCQDPDALPYAYVTYPCHALQVDAGEPRHEGDLHSDHNMTVAIFYNGYTDGCGAAP
jgi:transposase